ncbi:hypothetical protein GCM10027064_01790 [Microbacterium petrolearium]
MTDAGREYAQVQQQIAAQLERAMRMQQEIAEVTPTTVESADREVAVTLDERGLLADVRFAPSIAELEAGELEEIVMATVREARERRRPAMVSAGGAAALHDDTLRRRLLAMLPSRQDAATTGEERA